jgi:hypothetical protein
MNVMQVYTQRQVLTCKISEPIFARLISQSTEHDSDVLLQKKYLLWHFTTKIYFVHRAMFDKISNQNSINFEVWPLLSIGMVHNFCRIMKGKNCGCCVICLTCSEKVYCYIKLRWTREVPWMRMIMFLGPFHPAWYCFPV